MNLFLIFNSFLHAQFFSYRLIDNSNYIDIVEWQIKKERGIPKQLASITFIHPLTLTSVRLT